MDSLPEESPYFPLPGRHLLTMDCEFKESISRFKKALFRTVVQKRDMLQSSDEDELEIDQTQELISNTVDLKSVDGCSVSADAKSSVSASSASLDARSSQFPDQPVQPKPGQWFSPIATSPRLTALATEDWTTPGCEKCCEVRKTMREAKQLIRDQEIKVAELSAELSLSQVSVASLTAELARLKGKYEALFAQHLQVISDYKSTLAVCKELELKQCALEVIFPQKSVSEAENIKETLQKEVRRLRIREGKRASDLEPSLKPSKNYSFDSKTNSRRSESMKPSSLSQERHVSVQSLAHSPLNIGKPRISVSPRSTPSAKKHR